ncbi:LysR substrate-binding domain-containing protein [Roseibium sp. RKSG952]|uniref:LysR substrate-binding domain-containing protein n=1 Tax=Roseibium sp. RKSG952 TaxID=2529384 RepID=UPI0012BC8AE9|nr:LysR substrate-binding domain-containing protein [Roseibium sp. RKSG952]MTH99874.1 LysR family transcriptional regulator [Roseibium sp. RKSG952]
MPNLRRLLPSFRSLVVFEAAGRLGSFTRAGEELAMTQSAVSYAIKALEEDIGQPLFTRGHRTVALTDTGRRLHDDVGRNLLQLAHGIDAARLKPASNVVTLSVSTAFATLWIAPRLQRMRTELPDIELRLHTADRDLDIVSEDIPLGIRGGRPETWPGYNSTEFAAEEVVAVASPGYLAAYGVPEMPWELLDHHLAHLDEPYRHAATWKEWLASAGIPEVNPVRGTRANEYVAVLQMALDGDAIALGWRHLVEGFLQTGRLQQVTSHCYRTGNGFSLIWPEHKPLPQTCQSVRDWILAQSPAKGVTGLERMARIL